MPNLFPPLNNRFGLCFDYYNTGHYINHYPLHDLPAGLWYQDYNYSPHGNSPSGKGATSNPSNYPEQYQVLWNVVQSTAQLINVANNVLTFPGRKWLMGNEPDNASQSNNTPTQYAEGYYKAYNTIKGYDPTSAIYFGGISTISPQRLRWLDNVLNEYQTLYGSALPCDGIQAHGYIIQEQYGHPGIGLAVGISDIGDGRLGTAWINHTNIDVFKDDVYSMRQWMKDNDYQNKPLIISEYGSLLPAEGWLSTQDVQGQYLEDTFKFMLHTSDASLGCPLDNNLLVQGFAWYSAQSSIFTDGMLFNNYKLNKLGNYYKNFYQDYKETLILENEQDLLKENLWLIQK